MERLQSAAPEEAAYFYSSSAEEGIARGCIGHLRGDFGRSGEEFWVTWFPRNSPFETPTFQEELGKAFQVIGDQGVLKSRRHMLRFCSQHPEARIGGAWSTDVYGFRMETQDHRYYLRCFPFAGDYNFYLYCYARPERVTEQQRQASAVQKKKRNSNVSGNGGSGMFGELQPLASEETPYFYSAIATQSKELSYIGHLRGDFGTDDDQFWMSWSDHAGERRTLAFRQELAALVQHLQWQGLLLNLNEMRAYCRRHPEARIPGAWHSDVCGFCLQTTHYRYYIRCFPHLGDYSFYIYCYRKNHLLGRSVQQNQNGAVNLVKEDVQ